MYSLSKTTDFAHLPLRRVSSSRRLDKDILALQGQEIDIRWRDEKGILASARQEGDICLGETGERYNFMEGFWEEYLPWNDRRMIYWPWRNRLKVFLHRLMVLASARQGKRVLAWE